MSIGFFGLLTIVFITLKLMHYITWSWLWVFSPIWIPAALSIIFIVLFVLLKWNDNNKKIWTNKEGE
jgi:energy-coupling factor transporter transmembrane protein EcfT